MTPIQDLLHRIQWDPEFGRGEFLIGYLDRVAHRIVRVPWPQVRLAPGEHLKKARCSGRYFAGRQR